MPSATDPGQLAAAIAAGQLFTILDTRAPDAFARAHLPGSLYLPDRELPDRYGEIERARGPLVVVLPRSEEANASGPVPEAAAASSESASATSSESAGATPPTSELETLLRQAGFSDLITLDGLTRWTGPVERGEPSLEQAPLPDDPTDDVWGVGAPAKIVVAGAPSIRAWGCVLDLACGDGRNALFLAAHGFEVIAVDHDPARLANGRAAAERARLRVRWIEGDLEASPDAQAEARARAWRPQPESADAAVICRYLWRPLLPHVAAAVRPGGLLLAQTFTHEQPRFGRPTNPDFLLQPGELLRAFAGWAIESYREGPVFGREARASLIARKPMRAP